MRKTKQADVICRDCKHEFEITLEIDNQSKKFCCPKCKSSNLRGKKTWKPKESKKESVRIRLGWFDDVDVPNEELNQSVVQ